MLDPHSILVAASVAIPLLSAPFALYVRPSRIIAIAASVVSFCCLCAAGISPVERSHFGAGEHSLVADGFSAMPMMLFAAMVTGVLIASPRRDQTPRGNAGMLVLLSSTVAAYAASSPLIFFAAWTASCLPFLLRAWSAEAETRYNPARRMLPALALFSSCGLLGAAFALRAVAPSEDFAAFALLVLAALVRKGVFPFHTWVVSAFAEGPLLPVGVLVNAHLGALLIARVAIPLYSESASAALPLLSDLALVSALYTAFAGLGESHPRRLLAFLMLSQAAFILAGLESRTAEGITGALTHWLVVSTAMSGLLIVYRSLEARGVSVDTTAGNGLAARTPRFAVFFAICGLALVGLPGTLGFCAEDLLFHGALESHPLLGVALPLATALNAINIYRLFSRIFMGRQAEHTPRFPDALPRERFVLAGIVLCLIVPGLVPRHVIDLRTPAAHDLSQLLMNATRQSR
jgi:NADH-quinone oxidoreductase subunit M